MHDEVYNINSRSHKDIHDHFLCFNSRILSLWLHHNLGIALHNNHSCGQHAFAFTYYPNNQIHYFYNSHHENLHHHILCTRNNLLLCWIRHINSFSLHNRLSRHFPSFSFSDHIPNDHDFHHHHQIQHDNSHQEDIHKFWNHDDDSTAFNQDTSSFSRDAALHSDAGGSGGSGRSTRRK